MKYFLIAGEASGDMHAARLIAALHQRDADATFVGLGGDKMQAAGCRLYQHYNKMAYMGYVQVIRHMRDIRNNIRIAEQALLSEQPDELILIDYPGFNLHMAQFAKHHLPDMRVTYYIPPKIWAWKRWRVHSIGKYCDRILGIFPFEPDFYAQYGYACTYVGNPTAEAIMGYGGPITGDGLQDDEDYVVLLPGSRRHEIENCLPRMLAGTTKALEAYPDIRKIVVTAAPGIETEFYSSMLSGYPTVELRRDTYQAVAHARAAVVNSGTATLETALLGCPQVAVYHLAGGVMLDIMRFLVLRIPHFTLVNILAKRELIVELLARHFTVDSLASELNRLLSDEAYVAKIREGYAEIRQELGTRPAAETAADIITQNK